MHLFAPVLPRSQSKWLRRQVEKVADGCWQGKGPRCDDDSQGAVARGQSRTRTLAGRSSSSDVTPSNPLSRRDAHWGGSGSRVELPGRCERWVAVNERRSESQPFGTWARKKLRPTVKRFFRASTATCKI